MLVHGILSQAQYPTPAAAPAALLLDTYESATAAYSVRKLRTAYEGSAMQLFRSSDSATLDFGFDVNGYLDVAAVETWLAGADGYVNIWYDQSGNAYNMNFAGNTRPKIASSGTVTTLNGGKASMERLGSLGLDLGFKARGNKTVITCSTNYGTTSPTQGARIITNYPGNDAVGTHLLVDFYYTAGFRVFDGGDASGVRGYFPNSSVSQGSVIAGYTKNSGAINGIYNGSTDGSPGSGAGDSSDINVYAFEDTGGPTNNETPAGLSEIVIWTSVLDLAGISDNLNAFYSLY